MRQESGRLSNTIIGHVEFTWTEVDDLRDLLDNCVDLKVATALNIEKLTGCLETIQASFMGGRKVSENIQGSA